MTEETVTISKSWYEFLLYRDRVLAALDEFGVDNWEGYSDAMATLDEEDDGDEEI